MISDITKKIIFLKRLKGIGNKKIFSIFHRIESTDRYVELIQKLNLKYSDQEIEDAIKFTEEQCTEAYNRSHCIISICDDAFPGLMKETYDSPTLLYCNGNLEILKSKAVSIIGTRQPTDSGKEIAKRITVEFVKMSYCIVSGLAEGIDTIGHQTCIDNKGKTIAVLAQGLEKIYPKKNEGLARKIVENDGLLITEYPYFSYVSKSNFVQRDRIQAALSHSVVLIQTGLNGGSLHASRKIIDYGRILCVAGQSKSDQLNKEEKCLGNIELMKKDSMIAKKILNDNASYGDNIYCLESKDDFDDFFSLLSFRHKSNILSDRLV